MLRKIPVLFFLVLATWLAAQPASRHFTFHYEFTVRNPEPGKRLRIWIPLAHSDKFQDVKLLSAAGDLPLRRTHEQKFDNDMMYAEAAHATAAQYRFVIDYDVVRRERIVALNVSGAAPPAARVPVRELGKYLQPDRLVPVTGLPAQIAARAAQGLTTPLQRAHALYDYVLHNMRYEKAGTGGGRGDALYACDARKGNCTDFHSLFISMARSQNIPARFAIGFPVPGDKSSGEIAGYHCWADFYLAGAGWVPVDISEAWKHPALRGYFFGAHDANRVQFTLGRDLVLNPPQDGAPLNYFIYPYVELGGHEYANVSTDFSFAEVTGLAAKER